MKNISRTKARQKRHLRLRKNLSGTPSCPRMSVFRSNKHISVQIIDDQNHKTLTMASSLKMENGSNIDAAKKVGSEIGKKAKTAKISKVVFDRGGNLYHGRIKALAEAAKKEGIIF